MIMHYFCVGWRVEGVSQSVPLVQLIELNHAKGALSGVTSILLHKSLTQPQQSSALEYTDL